MKVHVVCSGNKSNIALVMQIAGFALCCTFLPEIQL